MNKFVTGVAFALLAATGVAAADEAAVQALELKCEAAREAKLKPLRNAEIARCKTEKNKEEGYCERYWSDYGDAKRNPNGTMQPRMFSDLPECVAAEDARRKLRLGE
jgi:hypothetical protein